MASKLTGSHRDIQLSFCGTHNKYFESCLSYKRSGGRAVKSRSKNHHLQQGCPIPYGSYMLQAQDICYIFIPFLSINVRLCLVAHVIQSHKYCLHAFQNVFCLSEKLFSGNRWSLPHLEMLTVIQRHVTRCDKGKIKLSRLDRKRQRP